ncbi:hypothetical protein ACHAQH_004098 [Verticillium albo-atrum]
MSTESGVLPPARRPRLDHYKTFSLLPARSASPADRQARKLAHLTGETLAFPDDIRKQTITFPSSKGSSIYSTDMPLSEPARTLGMLETESAGRPASCAPWTPASPVPPQVQFEPDGAAQRESLSAGMRSPSLHHFETIPARRSNHNEHSVDGARDLR